MATSPELSVLERYMLVLINEIETLIASLKMPEAPAAVISKAMVSINNKPIIENIARKQYLLKILKDIYE